MVKCSFFPQLNEVAHALQQYFGVNFEKYQAEQSLN